jgi:hypothetical protein
MTYPDSSDEGHLLNRRVLVGIAMMLVGVAMLADRNDGWRLDSSGWWPLFVLFVGAVKVVDPGYRKGRRRSRRGGVWLLAVGAWGLVSEAELFGFDYTTSWPLLIIALGLIIAWRAVEEAGRPRKIQEN